MRIESQASWIRTWGLVALTLLVASNVAFAAPKTPVKKTGLRVFFVQGQVVEYPSPWQLFDFEERIVFPELITTIDAVSQDPAVRTLLIRFGPSAFGMAQHEEVAAAIKRAKERGKNVVVHANSLSNGALISATAGTRLNLAPEGTITLTGIQLTLSYYKDLLTTLGIEADMEAMGRYKSAAEAYTRRTISPAAKEALDAVADSLYGQLKKHLSTQRRLKPKAVHALFEKGIVPSESALKHRLVDSSLHWPTLLARIKKAHGTDIKRVFPRIKKRPDFSSIFSLLSFLTRGSTTRSSGRPQIAVLVGEGPIELGEAGSNPLNAEGSIASAELVREIEKLAKDKKVKAIVLRLNTPGGSALASDIIWQTIRETNKQKPVVTSMGNVAASGGYYMASASRWIVADPTTLTGSIGVFGGKLVYKELFKKVGIGSVVIQRGKHAGLFSPLTPFNPQERTVLKKELQRVYDTFVNRVAKGRRMSYDAVHRVAQGRIWTGKQARSVGLVDELGGLDRAIRKAAKLARLDLEKIEVTILPKQKSILEALSDDKYALQMIGFPGMKLLPLRLRQTLTHLANALVRGLGQSQTMTALPFHIGVR